RARLRSRSRARDCCLAPYHRPARLPLRDRLSERERGQFHDLASGERGLVRTKADARPVRRLAGVWIRIAILDQCRDEFVREVWMRSAMASALHKAQVGLLAHVIDALRRERTD